MSGPMYFRNRSVRHPSSLSAEITWTETRRPSFLEGHLEGFHLEDKVSVGSGTGQKADGSLPIHEANSFLVLGKRAKGRHDSICLTADYSEISMPR